MNFGEMQSVWLIDDQGNRFPAVAVEPPNGPESYTFTFRFDERVQTQIEQHHGRVTKRSVDKSSGELNERWGFDKIPGEGLPCYATLCTRSREDGAYINEQGQWRYADNGQEPHPPDDFDCIWDGFKVEPRE